jgi:8-oxo-dGTP diphosphatase
MKKYVLGFAFNSTGSRVVLIRKKRPDWQAGRLNGIGGHIESGEWEEDAMKREFMEETGVVISDWDEFACMSNPDFICHCYRAFDDSAMQAYTRTDEEVVIRAVEAIKNCDSRVMIENLQWLIPLALDTRVFFNEVTYHA